ncbi:MAG: hypothetical protein AAFN38_08145 [Cyanobacteria bacterium J06560_5]
MTSQTQGPLTVLASGVVFGLAGFWLLPGQAKGVIVGATAGSVAAAGHIHQTKRLQQLERQHKVDEHRLRVQLNQAVTTIEQVGLETQGQKTALHQLANTLGAKPAAPPRQPLVKSNSRPLEQNTVGTADLEAASERTSALATPSNTTGQGATSGDEAAQAVIEWFTQQQVEVDNYYEPDPRIDRLLDGLALYLGDNYATLQKFHWKLRSSIGRKTHFDLGNYDDRAKRIHKRYLKKLASSDYLSLSRYDDNRKGKPDLIIAASYQERSDIKGFFDGIWFERFIYNKVTELFDAKGVEYQYLRNPRVSYSDGKLAELDLFFLVNEHPLLIECKAGQSSQSKGMEKFKQNQERLGLDANHAILVVLDIDEDQAHLRTTNWGFTVADQNDFLARIGEIISVGEGLGDSDEDEDTDERATAATDDSLEVFFKKQNLNLSPTSRAPVFNELIRFFETVEAPISFTVLVKTLRDRLQTDFSISRKKIDEILNGLRFAGLFLNENNQPVFNTAFPVYTLASSDPSTFEERYIANLTGRILHLYDPDFFNELENIALFESLTQGKAPSAEQIEHIKEDA